MISIDWWRWWHQCQDPGSHEEKRRGMKLKDEVVETQ